VKFLFFNFFWFINFKTNLKTFTVALISRKDGELGEIGVDTVIEKLVDEIKKRSL
jgi:hypothetical protein